MSRPITTLAIFLLTFSLFSQMLVSTGVAATIGIDAQVSDGEINETVTEETEGEVTTGASSGNTLFGLYNQVTTQIQNILSIFNPGMTMLGNAGVPDPIVETLLKPLATLVKFIGLVSLVRGWDL